MTRLAAGVAHELRNPLAVILARVQLLQHGLRAGKPPDGDKLARTLGAIEEQALRASKIIDNLSTFARPQPPELAPVDPDRTIREALAHLRERLEAARVAVEIDVAPDVGMIVADRAQLQAALAQLVLNAIEAMPGGGHVRVSARRTGDRVELSVADDGPGVAEADAARIFEAFVSTKRGAAGLGLCIVQTIAASHGGSIRLAAAGGPGAEFVLSLPARG
ncbi:MAG TPA: ATP-binding protein [Methylomirabilota bacterium]|nr:ATP-binding protein [Methylomirabilota bacterium]